jgi:hypothetical protein
MPDFRKISSCSFAMNATNLEVSASHALFAPSVTGGTLTLRNASDSFDKLTKTSKIQESIAGNQRHGT